MTPPKKCIAFVLLHIPLMHCNQDPSKKPDPDTDAVQPDLSEWKQAAGSTTAYIKKPANQRVITVDISSTLGKRAMMTSKESSFNSNSDEVGEYLHIHFYPSASYD